MEDEKCIRFSRKLDKMNMRWVLIEKWVKLVRLGVSQKMGEIE